MCIRDQFPPQHSAPFWCDGFAFSPCGTNNTWRSTRMVFTDEQGGVMRRILRVDVSEGKVAFEEIPEELVAFGGRALTSAIISREVDPKTDALGMANKLVIAPGLLAGTTSPNSSRLSVGAKSPLTGGIKESNVGGQASQKLGRRGVAAIILEGDPGDKKWVLSIDKDGAEMSDGSSYWGLGNYDCAERLQAAFGKKVASIQTGPAGAVSYTHLTAADDLTRVDLGGRRIIKK